jgi:hypothetical protein
MCRAAALTQGKEMIYFRGEGELIKTGFNIYPPRDWKNSRGFILKLSKDLKYVLRYAVKTKKLHVFINRREEKNNG